MKTSFRRVIEFDQAAGSYLRKHEKDKNKLTYAITRVNSQVLKANQRFNETLEEAFDTIRLDNCLTDPPNDPNGKVLKRSAGFDRQGNPLEQYDFTREGEKKCKQELRKAREEALDREDIEIVPHFVARVPDDLTDEELQGFSGFVIKAEDVEAMLQAREESEEAPAAIIEKSNGEDRAIA